MNENRYLVIGLGLIAAGIVGLMVVRLLFTGSFQGGMGDFGRADGQENGNDEEYANDENDA